MSSAATAHLWGQFLDRYDRRARTLPVLLCLLPALVVLVIVYPASVSWQNSALALLVWCGFFYLLSRIARDAGRRIQDQLFTAWSGAPTTQILRHRNVRIDGHTKKALHAKLSVLTGVAMPSPRIEQDDPAGADEAFRAVVLWLIKHTRDTQRFALLFKENINFGFQRNALGLRWVGAAIATLSAAWILVAAGVINSTSPYHHVERWQALNVPMGASLLISLAMLAVWLVAITPGAAKRTGFAYAERLIECTDVLTPDAVAQKGNGI
jgi:hypothetical protein